jgi:hypothetical protein
MLTECMMCFTPSETESRLHLDECLVPFRPELWFPYNQKTCCKYHVSCPGGIALADWDYLSCVLMCQVWYYAFDIFKKYQQIVFLLKGLSGNSHDPWKGKSQKHCLEELRPVIQMICSCLSRGLLSERRHVLTLNCAELWKRIVSGSNNEVNWFYLLYCYWEIMDGWCPTSSLHISWL